MSTLILLTFTTAFHHIHSRSRYFMQYYSSQPVDTCFPWIEYTINRCNTTHPEIHVLTQEMHDTPFCNSSNYTIRANYTMNITEINPNNLSITPYSFSCIGEDNYMVQRWSHNVTICEKALTDAAQLTPGEHYYDSYYATDVCVPWTRHDSPYAYKMYSCTGYYAQWAYYNDSLCTQHSDIDYILTKNLCSTSTWWSKWSFVKCVADNVEITPHTYDNNSNQSISINERMALIDFYASTTTFGQYLWMEYGDLCEEEWNLSRIAIEGNVFKNDGMSNICGVTTQNVSNKIVVSALEFSGTFLIGTVPESICKLNNLRSIEFGLEPYLEGTIPNCVAADLINLESLIIGHKYGLYKTPITGTIPEYIGNLPNFHDLTIRNTLMYGSLPDSVCNMSFPLPFNFVPYSYYGHVYPCSYQDDCIGINIRIQSTNINGTIPDCFNSDYNSDMSGIVHNLVIQTTDISGTIPSTLCNLKNFEWLYLSALTISGSIPDCGLTVESLGLVSMSHLTGTIPTDLFCYDMLVSLQIVENADLDRNQIPECFSEPKQFLYQVWLEDSGFYGSLPALPTNSIGGGYTLLYLSGNAFEGTIRDIFRNVLSNKRTVTSLDSLTLDNNDFYEEDISILLTYLWENAQKLRFLSFANNPQIHGTLPDLNLQLSASCFHDYYEQISGWCHFIFLAHSCDLSGTLPSSLSFDNIQLLTLHNNRLSGTIPHSLMINLEPIDRYRSIVLLGNLLWTDFNRGLPDFIDSPFKTAPNLYFSTSKQLGSIFIVIIACFSVLIMIYLVFHQIKSTKVDSDNTEHEFFKDLHFILQQLTDWKLLIIFFMLICFYPVLSNFYAVVPYESIFSVTWYLNDYEYIWLDWILVTIAIAFHGVILLGFVNTLHKYNKTKTHNKSVYQSEENDSEDIESHCIITFLKKVGKFILLLLLFVLWIFGICLIGMYLVASSLPNDNIFNLNQVTSTTITKAMSIILIINNKYIIPKFVQSIEWFFLKKLVGKYKFEIIAILRLNNIIFVPLIGSIFILHDCGKFWIKSWDHCNDPELLGKFNITVPDISHANIDEGTFDSVLTSDEVCDEPSLSHINFNRCIRAFLFHWIRVLMFKIIISYLFQILGLFFEIFKKKHLSAIKQSFSHISISVDDLWIDITLNMLTMIIFAFSAPLLLPLITFDIVLKGEINKHLVNKFNAEFRIKHQSNAEFVSFPSHLLYLGVILGQCLAMCFILFCIDNVIITTVFAISQLVSWFIMNIAIWKNMKLKTPEKVDGDSLAINAEGDAVVEFHAVRNRQSASEEIEENTRWLPKVMSTAL